MPDIGLFIILYDPTFRGKKRSFDTMTLRLSAGFCVYLAVCFLMASENMLYSQKNTSAEDRIFYFTQKRTHLKTGLFSYPKDYLISKETALKSQLYYKIEYNLSQQPKTEELYFDGHLVSHYKYYYNKTRLVKRMYYDNLRLIDWLNYFYDTKGALIRIERRDEDNKPTGDWSYFYPNGDLKKIVRYRNQKKSFIKIYKDGELAETKEILAKEIHITRYNKAGNVLSEKKLKRPDFRKISVLYEYQPLLLAEISDIRELNITRPHGSYEFKLSNKTRKNWSVSDGVSHYMAVTQKVFKLLKEIKDIHSIKIFKGDSLNPASYGLDKAKYRIDLLDKDKMKYKILVGDPVEGEDAYYVSNGLWDNVIYLVSRKILDGILYLNKYDYIKKRLFHVSLKKVEKLQFAGVSLVRKGNNWHCPSKGSVSLKENHQVVSDILSTEVKRFVIHEQERNSLAGQKAEIEIIVKSRERVMKVEVYRLDDKVFAGIESTGEFYEIWKRSLDRLLGYKKRYTSP